MSFGLTDAGEELIIKRVWTLDVSLPLAVTIRLYHDATDNIQDSEDIADITTEPTGAAYGPIGRGFGTSEFTASKVNGDWRAEADDCSYDASDSSQTIDAFFIVAEFQSEDKSDGSETDHIIARGGIGDEVDLSNESGTWNLTAPGMSLN